MNSLTVLAFALMTMAVFPSIAQEKGSPRPEVLLKEVVGGMPKGDKQEVRVLTATVNPGDKTPFHTHRFPVTVYVLQGTFTLELEGQKPVVAKAGQAIVEPPNVKMTGYNRSTTEPLRVLIVYVSDPETPFLDPVSK
jgi:quercetin dioxygenase-like cupin family protein